MKMFSLRTLIDDILLLVRNNNISESEDLSRDQIAAWVMHYVAFLKKREQDKKDAEDDDDDTDDSTVSTLGPLEVIDAPETEDESDASCNCCWQRLRTKEKVSTLNDVPDDIISVHDINGCVIQYMHHMRRHYHYFRRYTRLEPTCWYDNGYIYIDGPADDIDYIYVTANVDPVEDADDEADVTIPGWMVPEIKSSIMKTELAFMLNRPSDDINDSSLSSIKPHGYQTPRIQKGLYDS